MIKYTVYQVAPENQESPLFFSSECFPEDLTVFGNHSYKEHLSYEIKPIMKALRDGFLEYDLSDLEKVDEERAALKEWFAGIKNLSDEQVHDLARLIRNDSFSDYREDVYCGIFSILTGKQYDFQIMRGSTQDEWNYVFYVRDDWTNEGIDYFITEYFNTGTEWMVYTEEDEAMFPCSVYTHCWDVKRCKDEIAQFLECNPDEIQMFEFSGWQKIPKYKEVVF